MTITSGLEWQNIHGHCSNITSSRRTWRQRLGYIHLHWENKVHKDCRKALPVSKIPKQNKHFFTSTLKLHICVGHSCCHTLSIPIWLLMLGRIGIDLIVVTVSAFPPGCCCCFYYISIEERKAVERRLGGGGDHMYELLVQQQLLWNKKAAVLLVRRPTIKVEFVFPPHF